MQCVPPSDSPYSQADPAGKVDSRDDDLNARSRRWQRTGDPAALWPGIDVQALTSAAVAIEASVASCLDGRRSCLGRADGADARVIGIAALILGVGPLLGSWIEDGLLDVGGPVSHVLAAHLRHGRARLTRIVGGVRPVFNALAAAGVQPLVIKGFHAAHTYFAEPGVRPFADVDIIVRSSEIADAERTLSSLGFAPGKLARPFKREWLPPGVDRRIRSFELWHAESPWNVELHGGLFFDDLHRYGVDFSDAPSVHCDLGGIAARALTPPLRLVTTAAHFSTELSSMRLLRLVEMTRTVRGVGANTLDWAAVQDVLDRSGATRFVYPPFKLIEQLAPGTVPAPILDRARRASSRLARRVVAELRPATPVLSGSVSLSQRLMWASSPAQFLDRVQRMLVPDKRAGAFRVYQGRLYRLVTGRVSIGFRR